MYVLLSFFFNQEKKLKHIPLMLGHIILLESVTAEKFNLSHVKISLFSEQTISTYLILS